MKITLESTKIILLSAFVGAAITFGALQLTSNDNFQRQQITLLETRVHGLEALLAQKEERLKSTNAFAPAAFTQNSSVVTGNVGNNTSAPTQNSHAEMREISAEEIAAVAQKTDQAVKDLMTLFVGDQRSFSEKVNELIASDASAENIAVASTSIFNLADNRDVLPDDSLHSLYRDQANPDIKRVVAQVASMRGDNSLIDMRITETQPRLKSSNPEERQKALVDLAKTRYAGAANAIAPLLQDNDVGVKLDALLALRATGNQSHVRLVEELLNDSNESVSWLANDVINNLQNLSDRARTQLASADIASELPPIGPQ